MRRFSVALILLAALAPAACDDDGQEPVQRTPAVVVALSAASQSGTVGNAVPQAPRVAVRDAAGHPVEGVAVTFAIVEGGGTLTTAGATTNAEGEATAGEWKLGPKPGLNRLTATVANLQPVGFEAVAGAGPPSRLEKYSGDAQTGIAGKPLGAPIVVHVMDALGNSVAGALVQFAVTGGGGIVTAAAITGADGRAQASWTLGPGAQQAVTAALPGTTTSVSFSATGLPGAAASLTILSGDGQTALAGQTLPQPIRVTVRDEFGNPVGAGTLVRFSPSQGSQVAAPETLTDAAGNAGTQWTLRPTPGTNAVTASLANGAAVLFFATGTAGAAVRMIAVSGDGQTGIVGEQLAPLVVQVLDAAGNPVGAGVGVTFLALHGSVSPESTVTDHNGQAESVWTLGLVPGAQAVRVALTADTTVVLAFDATAVAGGATTLSLISGDAQSGLPGQPLAAPLVVRVTDATSNPVAGATVDFAVTGGGGSVTPLSATTDAAGNASTIWTLGPAGSQTATATLAGVPGQTVTFTASLSVGTPAQISIVSGNAQTGDAGSALAAPIVVLVQDAANNPVPGVTVDFGVTAGGGSFSPVSPTTNAAGTASATWTLGIFPGPNTGTAGVSSAPALVVNLSATANAPPFSALSLGAHSCGFASVVFCWGPNGFGELGDGTTTARAQPTLVAGGIVFNSITVGNELTCGIASGAAWCWGYNASGSVGDGTTTNRSVPTAVAGGLSFSMIDADRHACGIATGGQAYCWGPNTNGKLGDGTTTNRLVPTPVSGAFTFSFIAVGQDHSCALTAGGAAYCWGANGSAQLGDGTTTPRTQPTPVLGGLTFASISLGASHTCALTTTGQAYCWGGNGAGQLGDGTNTQRTSPVPVSGGLAFGSLDSGQNHNCGLVGSAAWCWGGNFYGQLGDGSNTARTAPVPVTGGHSFVAIATGLSHSCGVAATSSWCWGSNYAGRLGDGNPGVDSSIPVAVIQP